MQTCIRHYLHAADCHRCCRYCPPWSPYCQCVKAALTFEDCTSIHCRNVRLSSLTGHVVAAELDLSLQPRRRLNDGFREVSPERQVLLQQPAPKSDIVIIFPLVQLVPDFEVICEGTCRLTPCFARSGASCVQRPYIYYFAAVSSITCSNATVISFAILHGMQNPSGLIEASGER